MKPFDGEGDRHPDDGGEDAVLPQHAQNVRLLYEVIRGLPIGKANRLPKRECDERHHFGGGEDWSVAGGVPW